MKLKKHKRRRHRADPSHGPAHTSEGIRVALERRAAAALRDAGRGDSASEVARQVERLRSDEIAAARDGCLRRLPPDHPVAAALEAVGDEAYAVQWRLDECGLRARVRHPALDRARALVAELDERRDAAAEAQARAAFVARSRALAPVGPLIEPPHLSYWWMRDGTELVIVAEDGVETFRAGSLERGRATLDLVVHGEEIRTTHWAPDAPEIRPSTDGYYYVRVPGGCLTSFVAAVRGGLAMRFGDSRRYTLGGVRWLGMVAPPRGLL